MNIYREFHLFPSRYLSFFLFFFSLILRMIYINALKDQNPFFDYPIVDSEVYHEWALNIVSGDFLGQDIFYLAPGYAYFLAGIYLVFGANFYILYLLQATLDAFSVLLIFRIGQSYFNQRAGLLAALLWSLYGPAAFYAGKVAAESLGIFLILSGLFLARLALERESSILILPAGLLTGMAVLTRTYWLILIPFWLAHLFFLESTSLRKRGALCFFFIMGVLVAIGPVTVRNQLLAGEFVLVSGNSGLILYSGNNPKARGYSTQIEGISLNVKEQWADSKTVAERELGRPLTRKEIDAYWTKKALHFITSDPLAYLSLLGKKLIASMSGMERSTMYFFDYEKGLTPFLRLFFLNFYIIMPIGLTGLFLARNIRKYGLLHGMLFTHLLVLLIFMAESRYRLPVVPVLCLFASFLTLNFRQVLKKRPPAILMVVLLSAFSTVQYVQAYRSPHRPAALYFNLGNAYLHRGEFNKAIDRYEMAYPLKPAYPELLTNLGKAHYLMGNKEVAIHLWKRAHRLRPEYLIPIYNLAKAYQEKDIQKAKTYWRSYLKLARQFPDERRYVVEGEIFLKQWDQKVDDLSDQSGLHPLR